MNLSEGAKRWMGGFFALFASAAFFLFPQQAAQGVQQGLLRCYQSLIPALFPFFILSELFLQSPLVKIVQMIFSPLCRLMHLPRESSGFLLSGWIGGFAASAAGIGHAVSDGRLSKPQASLLLCACSAAGPSFVVGAVGCFLLKSPLMGALLYFSQLAACVLSTAVLCRLYRCPPSSALNTVQARSFSDILSSAVSSTLTVCGYVVFFQLLFALLPLDRFRWAAACLLEMTLGCSESILLNGYAPFAAAASISLLGCCAFLQISSLTGGVSLLLLLASRLLHLPIMCGCLYLLLRFLPASSTVWVSHNTPVALPLRMPADAAVMFFIFVCCAVYSCRFALSRRKAGV